MIAFILAKLFLHEKRRARTVDELVTTALNVPRFAHLIIHWADLGMKNERYPTRPRFVLNLKTNCAYWIPAYVDNLWRERVVRGIEHETEARLYQWFRDEHIAVFGRLPIDNELSLDPSMPLSERSDSRPSGVY